MRLTDTDTIATKAHWLLATPRLLTDKPLVLCNEFERCTDALSLT